MVFFGLDIGTNSIKIVQLQPLKEKFKLLTYNYVPTPAKSFFSEAESDLVLLAETIKKAVKDAKITTNYCTVSLPEPQVINSVIELPPMSESELAEVIKWEAEQYIPLPLNEVRLAWDILKMPKEGETGEKMKVLLVAAPLRLIDRYLKILSLAGLKPVAIETEMLAILRAVRSDFGEKPSILVNLGASSTQVAIVEEGTFMFIKSIPTGGTALARAVASELGLDIAQAEEYKKSYGLDETKLQGKVSEAIKPVFGNIIEEIKKALFFHQQKNPNNPISKAVLTGGTARLPGLVTHFVNELSLEVLVGNPWNNIVLEPQVAKEIGDDGYLYACAVGLAMKEI